MSHPSMELVPRDDDEKQAKQVYQELVGQALQLLLESATSHSKKKHLSLDEPIALCSEYCRRVPKSSSLPFAAGLILSLFGVVKLVSPAPLSYEPLCPPTVMSFLDFFKNHYSEFVFLLGSQDEELISFLSDPSKQPEPELWTSSDPSPAPPPPGVLCYWTLVSRLLRFGCVQHAKDLLKCHSSYRDLFSRPDHSASDRQLIEDWAGLFELLDTVDELFPGCLPHLDDADLPSSGVLESTSFLRVHTNWKKEVKRQLADPNIKLLRTLPQLKNYVLKPLAFEADAHHGLRDMHWSETVIPTLLYTNPFSTLDDIYFLIHKLSASRGSEKTKKFDALLLSMLSPPDSREHLRPHEVLSKHIIDIIGDIASSSSDFFWNAALCHACAAIAFEYQWRVSCYAAAATPLNEEAPPFPDEHFRLEVLLEAARALSKLEPSSEGEQPDGGAQDKELAMRNSANLVLLALTRAVASPPRSGAADADLLVITDRPPSRLCVEKVTKHLQSFVDLDCYGIVRPDDEAADAAAKFLIEEVNGGAGAIYKRLHMGGKPAKPPRWASGIDFTKLIEGRKDVHMRRGTAAAACKWLSYFPHGSGAGNFRMNSFLEELAVDMMRAEVGIMSSSSPERELDALAKSIFFCSEVLRLYPPTPDSSPPPGAFRLLKGLFASAQAIVMVDNAGIWKGLASVLEAARTYGPGNVAGEGSCALFPTRLLRDLLDYVKVILEKLRGLQGGAGGGGDSRMQVGLDREAMDTFLELVVRYQGAAASGTANPMDPETTKKLNALIGQESIWTAVVENRKLSKNVEGCGEKKSGKRADKSIDDLLNLPNPDCF